MRISELPLVNNPSTTDDLPIDRNGVTYRVKYQALRGPQGEPGTDGQDGTIENLNVTATTLAPGSSATATYANNLLTLGIPRGNTGATGNGISSIQKTSTSGLVDTYTITMTNGSTATFTVTNGDGSVTVDTALSTSSTNPVQNKVIAEAVNAKANSADVYTKTQVDAALATKPSLSDLLDTVYPVGSIYMSISNANPGTLFGGTWVSFGEGRVLVGVDPEDEDFDDALNTGGEATVKLEFENYQFGVWTPLAPSGQDTSTTFTAAQSGLGISSKYIANENTPHNNMPPYITCYMWRRTA